MCQSLQIWPAAYFESDPAERGVVAQEGWHTEGFCLEGASAAPICQMDLGGAVAPFGTVPCSANAEFTGAVRSDVYVQYGGGTPTQPTGAYTIRANLREDMIPVAIRCPGAEVEVVCSNCPSMSIGTLTMELEYDRIADVLTAINDVAGRRLVQTYRRESTGTLEQFFTEDGSLAP